MAAERVTKLASQRAVVIFGASNCSMRCAVQTLFTDLGVTWTVHKLYKVPRGQAGTSRGRSPAAWLAGSSPVPVVFIWGALVGLTDRVMSLHLGGQLMPLLHQAGALWL